MCNENSISLTVCVCYLLYTMKYVRSITYHIVYFKHYFSEELVTVNF